MSRQHRAALTPEREIARASKRALIGAMPRPYREFAPDAKARPSAKAHRCAAEFRHGTGHPMPREASHGSALRPTSRPDLVRRQAHSRPPMQDQRADPRPALRQRRVRGRTRLWRRDFQGHRAFRAAEALGASSWISKSPTASPRSTPPSAWCWRRTIRRKPMCGRSPGAAPSSSASRRRTTKFISPSPPGNGRAISIRRSD